MPWVVEMSAFNGVGEVTKLFAMGPGIAFTDAPFAESCLLKWESSTQRVDVGADGATKIDADDGRITLANLPPDAWSSGPLDDFEAWIWQNRIARLYWVPGLTWADRVLTSTGLVTQPVFGVTSSSTVDFELKDPRSALETPLQSKLFAGTNVGPVGLEGGPDLKDLPKPIVYGLVSNISPPRINDSLLIYQIADRAVSILCVRDGGVPLTTGLYRDGLGALVASEPDPGTYDWFSIDGGGDAGTYIRLGSTPIFNLTVDADEADTEADQSHAQIWKRIREDRLASTVDAPSIAAADAIDDHGCGFFWSDPITAKEALDEVLASFSGYETLAASGDWKVGKLVLPTGEPQLDLVQLNPRTRLGAKSRPIASMTRARPSYAPTGSPPYKVTVNWGRNYTVMAETEFAGVAATRLKQKFATEYRSAAVSNPLIWDPETRTGPWVDAPEITVSAAYQPGPDGITSPGAEAEAARLMALLGPMRATYQVSFIPKVGDVIECGAIARMTYPRLGLELGALFVVLQARLTVEKGVASAGLVLGLQEGPAVRSTSGGFGRITSDGARRRTE